MVSPCFRTERILFLSNVLDSYSTRFTLIAPRFIQQILPHHPIYEGLL